jgi:hypothetical protein
MEHAEPVELMATTLCALAQQCPKREAGAFQITQKATCIGGCFVVVDADEDPASGKRYHGPYAPLTIKTRYYGLYALLTNISTASNHLALPPKTSPKSVTSPNA